MSETSTKINLKFSSLYTSSLSVNVNKYLSPFWILLSWCNSVDQPSGGTCCLHIWSTRVECGQYMNREARWPINSPSSYPVFPVSFPHFTCMAYYNMLQAAEWKLKVINSFAICIDKVVVPMQKDVTGWQKLRDVYTSFMVAYLKI